MRPCEASLKPKAFKRALAIDPLHASAEFALARALQHTGQAAEAKEHFKVFQHLTNTKISSAIGMGYGERGHYSTVTPVEEKETGQAGMIAVKLEAGALLSPVPKAGPGAPRRCCGNGVRGTNCGVRIRCEGFPSGFPQRAHVL